MKDISVSEVLQELQNAMGDVTVEGITPKEGYEMLHEAGHTMKAPEDGVREARALFKRLVESGKAKVVKVVRYQWDNTPYKSSAIVFLDDA